MKKPKSHGLNKSLQLVSTAGVAAAAILVVMNSSAGIQGSGFKSLLAVGTVTGNGDATSIVVNGVAYGTSNAAIIIDGHPGTPGRIHAGDVVSLIAVGSSKGSEAAARQITFAGNARGKVSGIDTQASTLFLLGQTVHVNAHTIFSPNIKTGTLSGLQPGAVVEVSGFATSAGEMVATRIEAQGQSVGSRVIGAVQKLNPGQHTFYINSLLVDYGNAHLDGVLSDSVTVTVQGMNFAANGTLLANSVHASTTPHGAPGSTGRLQGLVTSYSAGTYFELNGQAVVVGPGTRQTLAVPLGLDVEVTVTGTFDTNGALVADTLQTSN